MFAANAQHEGRVCAASVRGGQLDEGADARFVEGDKRIVLQQALPQVRRQESMCVIAADPEGRLGQVVGAETEEIHARRQIRGTQRRAGQFNHDPELVGQGLGERLGLLWLEREARVLGGVRFIGTTLWTDFEALVPGGPGVSAAAQRTARDKAMRAANYHLRIAATTRDGAPFLAEQLRAQALICQQWLRAALAEPFAGPTVVVTHFAPSLRSHDPRYGLTPGTAGFCNALDELLPLADLWLHGHLHCAVDYRVGRCRVWANPLGYAAKGEQGAFDPAAVATLAPAAD